ncbi:MAG: hypothetical protein NT027_03235 [Proteobacteria bacterium]|nr:hypothetical protein [Pseudomonadota bacterium]
MKFIALMSLVLIASPVWSNCKARNHTRAGDSSDAKSVSTPKADWFTKSVMQVDERLAVFRLVMSKESRCFYLYEGAMSESGKDMVATAKYLNNFAITWEEAEAAAKPGRLIERLENEVVSDVQEIWAELEKEKTEESLQNKPIDDTWIANFKSFESVVKSAGEKKTKSAIPCPKMFPNAPSSQNSSSKSDLENPKKAEASSCEYSIYNPDEFTKSSTVQCGNLGEITERCRSFVMKAEFGELYETCNYFLSNECSGTTSRRRSCQHGKDCCNERLISCINQTQRSCR